MTVFYITLSVLAILGWMFYEMEVLPDTAASISGIIGNVCGTIVLVALFYQYVTIS